MKRLAYLILLAFVISPAPAQLLEGGVGVTNFPDNTDPAVFEAAIARVKDVDEGNQISEIQKSDDVKDLFARLEEVTAALEQGNLISRKLADGIGQQQPPDIDGALTTYRSTISAVSCDSKLPFYPALRSTTSSVDRFVVGKIFPAQACQAAKAGLGAVKEGNPDYDALKAAAKDDAVKFNRLKEQKADIDAVLGKIRSEKFEIRQRIDFKIKNISSVSTLPIIVGVICVFCLAIMLVVRQFDQPIQAEWVSTGQATQFVTIILLLSVITMLAVNDRIGENTLGTLLGGVAGYVLAQGVGRASARQAERQAAGDNPGAPGK